MRELGLTFSSVVSGNNWFCLMIAFGNALQTFSWRFFTIVWYLQVFPYKSLQTVERTGRLEVFRFQGNFADSWSFEKFEPLVWGNKRHLQVLVPFHNFRRKLEELQCFWGLSSGFQLFWGRSLNLELFQGLFEKWRHFETFSVKIWSFQEFHVEVSSLQIFTYMYKERHKLILWSPNHWLKKNKWIYLNSKGLRFFI